MPVNSSYFSKHAIFVILTMLAKRNYWPVLVMISNECGYEVSHKRLSLSCDPEIWTAWAGSRDLLWRVYLESLA